MAAFGLIEVLERRFEEDSIGIHKPSDLLESGDHDVLLLVSEVL
jgi:hypothetical protein